MSSTTPVTVDTPYDRIVFDCDSTLSRIEGVDELSAEHRDEIAELTREAMAGRMKLEDVYGRRLDVIQPHRNAVATVGRKYIEHATPDARDVIAALKSLGKEIRIVSGGIRLAVVTFAGWLGLKDEHVFAVKVYFDSDSHYRGYERENPLTRSDGKIEVLAGLPPARTAFIGDGVTDLAAKGEVDTFICYSGTAARPEVEVGADHVVRTESLAGILPAVCTATELDTLRRAPRLEHLVRTAERG